MWYKNITIISPLKRSAHREGNKEINQSIRHFESIKSENSHISWTRFFSSHGSGYVCRMTMRFARRGHNTYRYLLTLVEKQKINAKT